MEVAYCADTWSMGGAPGGAAALGTKMTQWRLRPGCNDPLNFGHRSYGAKTTEMTADEDINGWMGKHKLALLIQSTQGKASAAEALGDMAWSLPCQN